MSSMQCVPPAECLDRLEVAMTALMATMMQIGGLDIHDEAGIDACAAQIDAQTRTAVDAWARLISHPFALVAVRSSLAELAP